MHPDALAAHYRYGSPGGRQGCELLQRSAKLLADVWELTLRCCGEGQVGIVHSGLYLGRDRALCPGLGRDEPFLRAAAWRGAGRPGRDPGRKGRHHFRRGGSDYSYRSKKSKCQQINLGFEKNNPDLERCCQGHCISPDLEWSLGLEVDHHCCRRQKCRCPTGLATAERERRLTNRSNASEIWLYMRKDDDEILELKPV